MEWKEANEAKITWTTQTTINIIRNCIARCIHSMHLWIVFLFLFLLLLIFAFNPVQCTLCLSVFMFSKEIVGYWWIYCVCVYFWFRQNVVVPHFYFLTNRKSYFSFLCFCTWFFSSFFVVFNNLYLLFGWCLRGNIEVEKPKRGGRFFCVCRSGGQ